MSFPPTTKLRSPPTTPPLTAVPRVPRKRAHDMVQAVHQRIRDGEWTPGAQLPTESALMQAFGVSRTVVREALSHLQAAGVVHTRHGIGTFVLRAPDTPAYRVQPDRLATLRDVVAVLELRVGVETECAALAASRRTDAHLRELKKSLDDFASAVHQGEDAVMADRRFHLEMARATGNAHYMELMSALGASLIPRARLTPTSDELPSSEGRDYLLRIHDEHTVIFQAIAQGDAESARAAMRLHLSHALRRRRQMLG